MPEPRPAANEARRVWLLARRGTSTNSLLVEAFGPFGVEAARIDPTEARARVGVADTAIGRLDVRPTLDGVERGLEDLRSLRRRGVDVLNPAGALLVAHDKLQTALALARTGVAHPRTAHIGPETTWPPIRPPFVVKPRFGSWGWDVELCETDADARRCLRLLHRRAWFTRQGALVQELVEPLGRDLRVIVAGGEVVGAVERLSAPGEWRTNVALGGSRRRVEAPAAAADAARAAAAAIRADLVGVDLLPKRDGGWVVLELNGAVDFTHEYSGRAGNVFDRVAARLLPAPDVALERPVPARTVWPLRACAAPAG